MIADRWTGRLTVLTLILSTPAWAEVTDLTNEQLAERAAAGVPVIDIRRPAEWEQTGVVPGSHLLTFFDERGNYDLDAWLRELAKITGKDEPFILVCRTGNRTSQVGRYLDGQLGFGQVLHLEHGITQWIAAGRPVERPAP